MLVCLSLSLCLSRVTSSSPESRYSQFVPMEERTREKEEPDDAIPRSAPVPFRFFSPRECARLQGFPDSYQLCRWGLAILNDRNRSISIGHYWSLVDG